MIIAQCRLHFRICMIENVVAGDNGNETSQRLLASTFNHAGRRRKKRKRNKNLAVLTCAWILKKH
ncbi:hypothetical protein HN011_000164, partial [Eciton burchellii]